MSHLVPDQSMVNKVFSHFRAITLPDIETLKEVYDRLEKFLKK